MDFQIFAQELEGLVNRYNTLANYPLTHQIDDKGTIKSIKVYRSEVHFLDIVSTQNGINTTSLSQKLGITKGAVTQNMNRLIEKGLVYRISSRQKGNEIEIYLTEAGQSICRDHLQYHKEMLGNIEKCFQELTPSELEHLISIMDAFKQFFTIKENQNHVSSISKNS